MWEINDGKILYLLRDNIRFIRIAAGRVLLPQFMTIIFFKRFSGVTDDNQLIHFVLSVHPKYGLSPEWMMFYAGKIAQLLNEYQIVYGVHTDTDHTHVHFMMNPVSVKSGRVITRTKAEWQIRMICGTLFPD